MPFPLTCFVPGPWPNAAAVPVLDSTWTAEWIPNDGQFAEAFRGTPARTRAAEIARCPGALVISGRLDLPADPGPLQALARTLASAGALAVRVEQSKTGYPAETWAELLGQGALFAALIVTVNGRPGPYTCGMHVFGLPDASVDDPADGVRILTTLCQYQLYEAPLLLPGHTFSPDAETPRRTLERWPDPNFSRAHPCRNPFGVWRLLRTSDRKPDRLVPTFMPPLVALLTAAETRAQRALEREEVEALRDGAVCIAMDPADARTMERSRGYADLDPELAWEQWQIART